MRDHVSPTVPPASNGKSRSANVNASWAYRGYRFLSAPECLTKKEHRNVRERRRWSAGRTWRKKDIRALLGTFERSTAVAHSVATPLTRCPGLDICLFGAQRESAAPPEGLWSAPRSAPNAVTKNGSDRVISGRAGTRR
jgi:hypothetical protein